MMETARLFNPGEVTDLKPTAVTVDSLKAFLFFGSLLSTLKSERSSRWHIDPLIWWYQESLPSWSKGFSKIVHHLHQ